MFKGLITSHINPPTSLCNCWFIKNTQEKYFELLIRRGLPRALSIGDENLKHATDTNLNLATVMYHKLTKHSLHNLHPIH